MSFFFVFFYFSVLTATERLKKDITSADFKFSSLFHLRSNGFFDSVLLIVQMMKLYDCILIIIIKKIDDDDDNEYVHVNNTIQVSRPVTTSFCRPDTS